MLHAGAVDFLQLLAPWQKPIYVYFIRRDASKKEREQLVYGYMYTYLHTSTISDLFLSKNGADEYVLSFFSFSCNFERGLEF